MDHSVAFTWEGCEKGGRHAKRMTVVLFLPFRDRQGYPNGCWRILLLEEYGDIWRIL